MTVPTYITNFADNENRLQMAIQEKGQTIEANMNKHQLKKDELNILFVAYKELDQLQLFAKSKKHKKYYKIQTYPICQRSGILGPKRMEGDLQVPEGLYHIDRFNAKSRYYLSLGLNYPNDLDKSLGRTGSDIFIHGKCETKGCLPMTDDLIKEIYLYALWAKEAGQQYIPVYIFPFEMTTANMLKHQNKVEEWVFTFWKNLQKGYNLFIQHQLEIEFINDKGDYSFLLKNNKL